MFHDHYESENNQNVLGDFEDSKTISLFPFTVFLNPFDMLHCKLIIRKGRYVKKNTLQNYQRKKKIELIFSFRYKTFIKHYERSFLYQTSCRSIS